jgi:hypothetical protein
MEGRPEVTRRVNTTRITNFTISPNLHVEILVAYLRKHYPEFRGFADDAFEMDFNPDGSALVKAHKESFSQ